MGYSLSSQLHLAIVHDALVNRGGAERTVTFMCEAFPDAPLFTSVYLPDRTYPEFNARQVHTLPGARWVHTERGTKQLLPLWIAGFHCLNLANFDVVLSSSTWSAKFVRHPHHVCYCYAPFRVLWKPQSYSNQSLPIGRTLLAGMNVIRPLLRRVDFWVMQRIPRIATSCQNMAGEIRDAYRRDARVIYPPVRLSDYAVSDLGGDYYLTVGRLISHKRIDLAVQACRTLGRRLVVVGEGPEQARLQASADENIYFAGPVSDTKLKDLYRNCRAVIFPSHEDYGIVPIEAQASGRPVVA